MAVSSSVDVVMAVGLVWLSAVVLMSSLALLSEGEAELVSVLVWSSSEVSMSSWLWEGDLVVVVSTSAF